MLRKKSLLIIVTVMLSVLLAACGSVSKTVADYGDAESFEAALNRGENLEGKTVIFIAKELHPDSKLGYNVWAGEHLNFVSGRNPDIKEGEAVAVKTTTIENLLGSWVIKYEKISAEVGDTTIVSSAGASDDEINSGSTDEAQSGSASFTVEDTANDVSEESKTSSFTADSVKGSAEEEKPLELVDYGWYADPPGYSDTIYVHFCGMVHNPNSHAVAFPDVIATVKNGDGSILATADQMGMSVMPDDTVTLIGMLPLPSGDISEDAQIFFDVEWSDYGAKDSAKTTDFVIENVSEHNGDQNFITGEVTNNWTEEVNANISMVLRKDGEIVFVENTFVDKCKPGKAKAFEFQRYSDWPEHDTIDISAQPW